MPIGDRLHRRKRRLIRDGDEYTIDEERDGLIDYDWPKPYSEPPIEIQGEPWGWTKGEPYPRGYREDGKYEPQKDMDA